MKKEPKIVEETILSEEEARKIKECLLYLRHRFLKHPGCGVYKVIKPEVLEKFIKELC